MDASRLAGIQSLHVSLPRCPEAAYRCTHEHLRSVSIQDQRAVCALVLSGEGCKRVPRSSVPQTALQGLKHFTAGQALHYSFTELPASLSCTNTMKVAF